MGASPSPATRHSSVGRWIAAHPVWAFLILAIGLTWIAQVLAILLLGDITPGILAELIILLGATVLVTAIAEGRPGVRRLFAQVVRWRVGIGWYVVAVVALPVLTLLVALATGTFQNPDAGWPALTGFYLLQTVIWGALLANIWEELAWTGLVQRRWMERWGLLGGSALTAIPFVLIHLPMVFGQGFNVAFNDVLLSWGLLVVVALLVRVLYGITYLETGGSVLLVGLLHASFNASGQLPAMIGGWQQIVAMMVLLAIVALYRVGRLRRKGRRFNIGRVRTV
ncbi:CPBP family intramembrane glutamic endopeptidase [Salinibacterium sp. ZJ450]|uniref:CPBP family intramembrane glutamic endopeptidase n=1 Tax=Salinibacterium sp. ZJ450 TaxID=2708338 RepID=UPI0014205369|nr:CPBP family intramembrane glutamic endopeptidase [Salinibacterium sp. ZJ450]